MNIKYDDKLLSIIEEIQNLKISDRNFLAQLKNEVISGFEEINNSLLPFERYKIYNASNCISNQADQYNINKVEQDYTNANSAIEINAYGINSNDVLSIPVNVPYGDYIISIRIKRAKETVNTNPIFDIINESNDNDVIGQIKKSDIKEKYTMVNLFISVDGENINSKDNILLQINKSNPIEADDVYMIDQVLINPVFGAIGPSGDEVNVSTNYGKLTVNNINYIK